MIFCQAFYICFLYDISFYRFSSCHVCCSSKSCPKRPQLLFDLFFTFAIIANETRRRNQRFYTFLSQRNFMDSQTRKTKPKYEMIKETLLARIHAGDFSFDESFCTEKCCRSNTTSAGLPQSVLSRIWNSRGFCTGNVVSEALFREAFHRSAKQPIRRK